MGHREFALILDPRPVVCLLERIERHARLETLCQEFDNGVAKAFRRDIRSLGWLLKSCPDLMSADEVREALRELRKRYLVVPSEFQDLIDQAIREIEQSRAAAASARRKGPPARGSRRDEELLDVAR